MTISEMYGLKGAPPPAKTSAAAGRSIGRRHICHACGGAAISRDIRRGTMERWVLPLIGLRPYLCLDCGSRFIERSIAVRRPYKVPAGAPRPWPEYRKVANS